MQKYGDTFFKKIKRLIGAFLLQCLWFIPLMILIWYVKKNIGSWCYRYFEIEEARKMANLFAREAEQTGSPILWNPSTIILHLKTLFNSMTASAKLSSLTTLSDIIAKIVIVILWVVQIWAIIKLLVRTKRSYGIQKQTDTVTNTLCREIMPEIEDLKAEVQRLSNLLEQYQISPPANKPTDS